MEARRFYRGALYGSCPRVLCAPPPGPGLSAGRGPLDQPPGARRGTASWYFANYRLFFGTYRGYWWLYAE